MSAPLYAVFIAIGLELFGDDQLPIKLAQAVADSLTVVLLYFICRRIFEERIARVAAAIAAVYPFFIYAAASIGDETFFTLFLACFVLLGLHAIESGRWWLHCAAGALLALATLVRASVAVLSRLLAPDALCARRSESAHARAIRGVQRVLRAADRALDDPQLPGAGRVHPRRGQRWPPGARRGGRGVLHDSGQG